MTDSQPTLLRLTGRDALGVLHRIGTQALDDLTPGNARMTCFCDFRGRLLHRALIAVDRDGAAWLVRPDAPGEALAAFVDRHVFREDVAIENRSAGVAVTVAHDPKQAAAPRGASLEAMTVRWSGNASSAWAIETRPGVRYDVRPRTADDGPEPNEAARLDLAEPRHGHEIAEAFTPYEVGLASEVHLSKGCFTGQEALMRLVTYRSVRRGLFRIGGEGAAPDPETILTLANGRHGTITSVHGTASGWRGLAVLPLGTAAADFASVIAGGWCEAVDGGRPLGLPEDAPAH